MSVWSVSRNGAVEINREEREGREGREGTATSQKDATTKQGALPKAHCIEGAERRNNSSPG